MKHSFTLILAFLCSFSAAAQKFVSGKVQDTQSAPIAYATVSLLQTDSTLITGAITDEQGDFMLSAPAGKYLLKVSYIGYRTICRKVQSGDENLLLTLSEESKQLGEVEVKAKKQLIERQFDKIVLNVSNSPFAMGSNSRQCLREPTAAPSKR